MNNDLISRKWLTDAIRNRRTYLSYEDAKDVIDLINNAPTIGIKDQIAGAYNEGYMCGHKEAEKERPQGEWIYPEKTDKEKGYGGYCSNCKCDMPIFVEDWKQKYCETNFCPNCGAKMKGGAE